jgi:hypothetical protein
MQRRQCFESLTSQVILLAIFALAAILKHGYAVPPSPDYQEAALTNTSAAAQLAEGSLTASSRGASSR